MRKRFDIWLADLNPPKGTEPGKVRPVVIIQSDSLNELHPSTVVCPITSQTTDATRRLRVRIPTGVVDMESDILVDQIRSIDNRRLIKRIGKLTKAQSQQLEEGIRAVLDL